MVPEYAQDATIVLFGGTGDLASRKLLPALFENWRRGHLKNCLVVGVGRRFREPAEYLAFLRDHVGVAKSEGKLWADFEKSIDFHQGDIATPDDFQSLRTRLETIERPRGLPGNRLFYYAVGPSQFGPITKQLGAVGLLVPQPVGSKEPWVRIIVEKPYGRDAASARALDGELLSVIHEHQLFRIDHYLGKETVQNVLAFRFANGLFEPVWNQKYISSVQITVAESLGVEQRGAYYEQAGALRDMLQNHMLQILALTAMEPPISLEADAIRDEKVKVLRAIRIPSTPEQVKVTTVRGQYGPGTIGGQSVPGYRDEHDVSPTSITPTFLATVIKLDSWRWAHVPFYLRHGKRLAKRGTEIAIQFHTPPLALFRGTEICGNCTNLLVIRIQPNEGISLYFGAKKPGSGMRISNVKMDFEYDTEFREVVPEAYERLLLDALVGDATLFTRSDEVQAMWRYADALQSGWDDLAPIKLPNYPAGSWGPTQAEALFPQGDDIPTGACPFGWRRW